MVQAANSIEMLARQNCASILLAHQSNSSTASLKLSGVGNRLTSLDDRPFNCKDCGRKFRTFQALGGHRASHMKIRLTPNQNSGEEIVVKHRPAARLKIHDCKLCLDRFPTGQALGGHMRKHAELSGGKRKRAEKVENVLEGVEKNYIDSRFSVDVNEAKKMKSSRVVLELDLNFAPPVDDDFLQLV